MDVKWTYERLVHDYSEGIPLRKQRRPFGTRLYDAIYPDCA